MITGDPLLTMIAACVKLACSTVFVCSNYSKSVRSDGFSSFKAGLHMNLREILGGLKRD